MARFVALLRGINVSGSNRLPMADLRAIAQALAWGEIATYIQSGNLIFDGSGSTARMETALELAIRQRLGVTVPAIVRSAAQWRKLAAGNPFAEAAETEPNRLMLLLSKNKQSPNAAEALSERARDGERITSVDGALWIHYPGGAGTSRLSPALIDRLAGSPTTARNYRTVMKLADMLA